MVCWLDYTGKRYGWREDEVLSWPICGSRLSRNASGRPLVVLSGETEVHANVDTREFLTVCVLPGVLDETASMSSRYGTVRPRQRERVSWALKERLVAFPRRALVVVGASSPVHLEPLYEFLEDSRAADLDVILVWPEGQPDPDLPQSPANRFSLFRGSNEQWAQSATAVGAPTARQLPRWAIRVGTSTVDLSANDVRGIATAGHLVTERDLTPPDAFRFPDLIDFLDGKPTSWAAFHFGLPVSRSFRSTADLSLRDSVLQVLRGLGGHAATNVLIRLPAQGGSGATTLLREAAFHAAHEGFPTLLFNPSMTTFDLEGLASFATRVNEAALAQGVKDLVRLLVVVDAEHGRVVNTEEIVRKLAAQGRNVVVLQVVPAHDEADVTSLSGSRISLPTLAADAQADEINACHELFTSLATDWNLPIELPSHANWVKYQEATAWRSVQGNSSPSLFWVALRFFLTEGADAGSADALKNALGQWIQRRSSAVDGPMKEIVQSVAVLSWFRIVCPLWTALRPVSGGTFPSELVPVLEQLGDILIWDEYEEALQDQVLRFAHPSLADEFLRTLGAERIEDRLLLLEPLLSTLSPGQAGDRWIAEQISTEVIPPFAERPTAEWEWRLAVFDCLPPAVRDTNKTILHHWARALYQSADAVPEDRLPPSERRARNEAAIGKLERALDLPSEDRKGEHPSHILNTLGTAYARYAGRLRETFDDRSGEEAAWGAACSAFEKSLALTGGTNPDALYAFSLRLIRHAQDRSSEGLAEGILEDVSQALSLLDTAEELSAELQSADPNLESQLRVLRADALELLGRSQVVAFIEELKSSDRPELGFYCEARLALREPDEDIGRERAFRVLARAEAAGVALGARARLLEIRLYRQDPAKRFRFEELLKLYESVETDPSYISRSLDEFRHAVLCYQAGSFEEGARRFRRLRSRADTGFVRTKDRWADPRDPTRARITTARITRLTTEWRASAFVEELRQHVPLRPRHFSPVPRINDVVECIIRFEFNGPLAVPTRFDDGPSRSARAGTNAN